MGEVQVGPNDVPTDCEKCGKVTMHREDQDGVLHCLRCVTADTAAPKAAPAAAAAPTKDPPAVHWTVRLCVGLAAFAAIGALASKLYPTKAKFTPEQRDSYAQRVREEVAKMANVQWENHDPQGRGVTFLVQTTERQCEPIVDVLKAFENVPSCISIGCVHHRPWSPNEPRQDDDPRFLMTSWDGKFVFDNDRPSWKECGLK